MWWNFMYVKFHYIRTNCLCYIGLQDHNSTTAMASCCCTLLAYGVRVGSTRDTRTVWRAQWLSVASHPLNWKHSRWIDRAGWRSTCKSDGICANLVHHPPETSSARSAAGCVAHGLGFLPTTSHTRDDETRRIDGSVDDHDAVAPVYSMQWCKKLLPYVELRAYNPILYDTTFNGAMSLW